MSGMYKMVFGQQPHLKQLHALLQLVEPTDFGRLRDMWVEIEGDWLSIRVHTRNGGNNRADQKAAIDSMRAHPWFTRDADMGFDNTYADFWFTPPHDSRLADVPGMSERWTELRQWLSVIAVAPVDMPARWKDAIEALGGSVPT